MIVHSDIPTRYKVMLSIVAVTIFFFVLRIPGVSMPYHQDEWKNVSSGATIETAGDFFAHPPFMQIFFVVGDIIFGQDYFRLWPLLFSLLSVFVLYMTVRRRASTEVAIGAVLIYIICFYNVLGSLMADVDGSVLPLLFICSVYLYDRFVETDHHRASDRWKYLSLLVVVLLIGFMVKLSFALVIATIVIDYIWNNRKSITVSKLVSWVIMIICFCLLYVALVYIIHLVYPVFRVDIMLGHAGQFTSASGRNYIQVLVQGVKAIYYLSPILILSLFWGTRNIFNATRIFWLYLILGCIFYFVIFDFSRGALDKYLMFSVAPLTVISSYVLTNVLSSYKSKTWLVTTLFVIAVILVSLNFLPQTVVALYPKTEWFSYVLHGKWNILTPFTGGSGPLGFYVSFLFIALSYVVSVSAVVIGLIKRQWRGGMAIILIVASLMYNMVFAEEFLFGKINGNASEVLDEVTEFVQSSGDIEKVLTYNDIGAGELSRIDKYAGRIYATPDFEDGYKTKFASFNGQYVVVDIPHLYSNGFYGEFFSRCRVLFDTVSGVIHGFVYECPIGKDSDSSL